MRAAREDSDARAEHAAALECVEVRARIEAIEAETAEALHRDELARVADECDAAALDAASDARARALDDATDELEVARAKLSQGLRRLEQACGRVQPRAARDAFLGVWHSEGGSPTRPPHREAGRP